MSNKVTEGNAVSVGGMPFGHEWSSTANSIGAELGTAMRDKEKRKTEDEAKKKPKKKKEHHAKSFDDFKNQSKTLQEMEGGAATTTNTPGMGNVSPGEIGSYDDDDDDEVKDKKAMTQAQFKKWKLKKAKAQSSKKKKKGAEVQRPAWELGGRLPVPVGNTVQ